MKNNAIADIFEKMAVLLEIKDDNVFKIRAYQRAAETLRSLGEDVESLRAADRLGEISGVGEALKAKIEEYIDTGRVHAYDDLIKEVPESLLELTAVPSLGPKKAKLFYSKLNIKNIAELEEKAKSGELLKLPNVRQKTVDNILKGIGLLRQGLARMDIATASAVAESFLRPLKKMKEVEKISVAGSLRRLKETIRDIDILIVSSHPSAVMDRFIALPEVKQVLAHGETKSSVVTAGNVQVDLRVVEKKSFGAALLYFTGSKSFNVKLRQIAIKKKMKVNEYGLFSLDRGQEKFIAGKNEEEVLTRLGVVNCPPELREDFGEKDLFSLSEAPVLVETKDIKGDLHVHSVWSDGRSTVKELALAAKARGYSYLAISDHSQKLRVARGLKPEDLALKKKEIERLNGELKNFRVLFGAEVEIDSDGQIDYNDTLLKEFDFVIAAIHSGFEQGADRLTQRLLSACRHRFVDAIAHPTGTHLGKRAPYEIDLTQVCRAARDTGTMLEINAFPIRLDLNSQNAYFAKKQGVRFCINTDAHEVSQLNFMPFGVAVARRGWLSREDVANTLGLEQFLKTLKRCQS